MFIFVLQLLSQIAQNNFFDNFDIFFLQQLFFFSIFNKERPAQIQPPSRYVARHEWRKVDVGLTRSQHLDPPLLLRLRVLRRAAAVDARDPDPPWEGNILGRDIRVRIAARAFNDIFCGNNLHWAAFVWERPWQSYLRAHFGRLTYLASGKSDFSAKLGVKIEFWSEGFSAVQI